VGTNQVVKQIAKASADNQPTGTTNDESGESAKTTDIVSTK